MDDRALDPSLTLLLDALERTPDNAPLRVHVANLLVGAGRHADAIKHFRQCEGDAQVGTDAQLGIARAALALGDAEASLAAAEKLLASVPSHAKGLLARARALHARGQHKEALADYDKAVSLDAQLAEPALRDALIRDATDPRARFRVVSGGTNAAQDAGAAAAIPENSVPDRVTFADVGGLDEVKEKIRMRIVYPFSNPDMFKAFGKKIGGGILFYGPPGCGKTFLAKATAGECRAHFINVGLHEVLDMWIGNSEKQLHQLFEDARRRAPSVLFFDEVDALGMQRAKLHSGSMRGVITQFLAELDGFASRNERVLVIGATNTPWDLDSAFRRPGRFDQVLFVPPPDRAARRQILELKTTGKPLASVDFDAVAANTEGWSGADLEHLIDASAELALTQSIARGTIEPITGAHIDKARAKVRPTTREWFSTARNYAQYANEAGQYDDIADYIRRHNF
ncbi:MAG: AAA family ATPase [Myxococcales bacterium]|nr:AAA family ATPase [Myxococcales bacterium]